MTTKLQMDWLETHIGNMKEALAVAKKFSWKLSIDKGNEMVRIYDGEAQIIASDNEDCIDAFLYGLALAYVTIPEPYHTKLMEDLREWTDEL